MHATVVTVDIANFETARKALMEEVVPRARKAPGFLKGYWTVRSDTTQGLSFLVFDTKEHAEGAAQMVRSTQPPPGVKLNSVDIREVIADA